MPQEKKKKDKEHHVESNDDTIADDDTSSFVNKTLNNEETRAARTKRKHGWLTVRWRLNAKSKISEEGQDYYNFKLGDVISE